MEERTRTVVNKKQEIGTLPGPWAGLSIMRKNKRNRHGWMDR